MFTVKNLRKEKRGGWTYLVVDFDVTGIKSPFEEKTMWFAVENKNADMLTDDVYDAFTLVPLYLGMHYHQDVHIKGKISPRLYHNITHYLMKIFDNFSDYTKPVKFTVDGFKKAKKGPVDLIGTGISCGVDSLTTIYDNYIKTEDKSFKLNSLFLMNCGTHGDFEDKKTRKLWLKRAELNKKAADELGLPVFLIDSNLHAFTHIVGEVKMGFLAIYSCALCLQRFLKRYLTSSANSYEYCSEHSIENRDGLMSSYCETYMPHLISTERFELVIDGCQYERADKIKKICDWDISKKYLNVCLDPKDDGRNCSMCEKCVRTLLILEALGKLDNYRDVFDIETYNNHKRFYMCMYQVHNDERGESVRGCLKEHDMSLPNIMYAIPYYYFYRLNRKIRKILKDENK